METTTLGTRPPAEFFAQLAAMQPPGGFRITREGAPLTRHVGADDLPFLELQEGVATQLVQVDLGENIWIANYRLGPGTVVQTHYHTGFVFGVTQSGSWYYAESPDQVNRAGSHLFEPAGSVHTLTVPASNPGPTEVWFAVWGSNVNLKDDGTVDSIIDARGVLTLYRAGCEAIGASSEFLIVLGE